MNKAELAQIAEAGRKAQQQLDELNRREENEASRGQIGKCFKFRNCYSSPETEEDYWWLYSIRISANQRFTFQKDKYGEIKIHTEHISLPLSARYIEIEPTEFLAAWRAILAALPDDPLLLASTER